MLARTTRMNDAIADGSAPKLIENLNSGIKQITLPPPNGMLSNNPYVIAEAETSPNRRRYSFGGRDCVDLARNSEQSRPRVGSGGSTSGAGRYKACAQPISRCGRTCSDQQSSNSGGGGVRTSMETEKDKKSPQAGMVDFTIGRSAGHVTNVGRSISCRRATCSSAIIITNTGTGLTSQLTSAQRPMDLDLFSTTRRKMSGNNDGVDANGRRRLTVDSGNGNSDTYYRGRTFSMPASVALHGPASTASWTGSSSTSSSVHAARSIACRRAYSRKWRDDQCRIAGGNGGGTHLNCGVAVTDSLADSVDSGVFRTMADSGVAGMSSCVSPSTEVSAEYVRVRSFSTSSRVVKNRGDSFKRRYIMKSNSSASSSGHVLPEMSSSASSTPASATGNQANRRQSHAPVRTSLSLGGTGDVVGSQLGPNMKELDGPAVTKVLVTVVGDPAVGKRSIVRQMMTSEYMHGVVDSSPTNDGTLEQTVTVLVDHEESVLSFDVQNSIVIQLQQQHTSERYEKTPTTTATSVSDCYCIVYSVADRSAFNSALLTLSLLSRRLGADVACCTACILVGNKSDLVRQRQVDEDEGKLAAARYRCKFVEVSAVLNYKIDELLVGVVTQIRLKRRLKMASGVDCDAAVAGCYRQARGVVELLFGRNQRRHLFRSCDNLLSL